RRFAASSIRSRRPCPASRSASCCRTWLGSWTSSCRFARSSAAATIMPAINASPDISARTLLPAAGRTSAHRHRGCNGRCFPSSEFFSAMDISKEDQKTRDRYGYYDPSKPKGDGAPRVPQNLLLARRLIEAGVRVVTINYSFWDWHGQNFKNAKDELPIFDK